MNKELKMQSVEMRKTIEDSKAIRWLEGLLEVVIWLLDGWRRLIAAMERTLVDNVAATVPWLAPLPSSYIAYQNVAEQFGWHGFWGMVVAGVVEGLGLAVTSTAFQLWDWNDSNEEKDWGAFAVAVIALVFYLGVVITLNVILDLGATEIERAAKALLSLLPLVGSVTLALRAQHARRIEKKLQAEVSAQKQIDDARLALENEKDAEFKREELRKDNELKRELKLQKVANKVAEPVKVAGKVSETISEISETYGKWKTWLQLPPVEKEKIWVEVQKLAKPEAMRWIVTTYGTSERVAYTWIDYAFRDFGAKESV